MQNIYTLAQECETVNVYALSDPVSAYSDHIARKKKLQHIFFQRDASILSSDVGLEGECYSRF